MPQKPGQQARLGVLPQKPGQQARLAGQQARLGALQISFIFYYCYGPLPQKPGLQARAVTRSAFRVSSSSSTLLVAVYWSKLEPPTPWRFNGAFVSRELSLLAASSSRQFLAISCPFRHGCFFASN